MKTRGTYEQKRQASDTNTHTHRNTSSSKPYLRTPAKDESTESLDANAITIAKKYVTEWKPQVKTLYERRSIIHSDPANLCRSTVSTRFFIYQEEMEQACTRIEPYSSALALRPRIRTRWGGISRQAVLKRRGGRVSDGVSKLPCFSRSTDIYPHPATTRLPGLTVDGERRRGAGYTVEK